MTKATAPVVFLLSRLLFAALLLLPPSAPAAKAETNHPPSQQAADPEKSQDNDKDDDKNDAKPKVSVAITGPQAGTVITAPADIELTVEAQSTLKNKPIRWVAYFQGTTLLGIATQAPFAYTWKNAPAGSYTLTAVASNNKLEEEDKRKLEGKSDPDSHADGQYKLNPEHEIRSAPVNILLNAPPTAAITAPLADTLVTAPVNVVISAAASDRDGQIAKVEFYQGATLLGTVTQAPFAYTWADAPAGSYALTAIAYDNQGASTPSAAVPLIINAPPQAALTGPAEQTVLAAPADLTLSATASDPDGQIAKVEFYQGDTLLGTATSAPYTTTWKGAPAGSYRLSAIAYDNQGGQTTSAPLRVVVDALPQVNLTATVQGSAIAPATLTMTANATDSDGQITRVDFYQGATLLGTSSQAPYTFTWNHVPAGSYSLTAQATDNLGLQTPSLPVTLTIAPNQPPQVTLTAPTQNQRYPAQGNVSLNATASDADGNIVKVEFYQGDTLIGTATQAPFAYTWNTVPAGSYTLTAKATDDKGGSTASPPVSITVFAGMPHGIFYIHPDHLGTPRAVTDDADKVVWQNDLLGDPFGASLPDEDPDGDGQKFELNLRFPGQYYDKETGLHYNYHRDYDPGTGRYVQSDPIGLEGGINTYAYALSNPLSYTDPEGLAIPDAICKAVPACKRAVVWTLKKVWDGCKWVWKKVYANDPQPPQGVPENWTPTPTNKGGGTKWTNPENPHDFVRDMPGNPNSPNSAQQNPYVVQMRDGKAIDVNGNPVSPSSPGAHIPTEQFNFRP